MNKNKASARRFSNKNGNFAPVLRIAHMNRIFREYRAWALITGAASGMGREYARRLALMGYNLVLVDINAKGLEETESIVREAVQASAQVPASSKASFKVLPVVQDLSQTDAADRVYEQTEAAGCEVEVLVKDGAVAGYVVKASAEGYNRSVPVVLAVGFDTEATILDVVVLEQQETPSLGGKMSEGGNVLLQSVKGKNAAKLNFALRLAGGDVDAITSATISSRAYAKALAEAYETYKKVNL